MRIPVPYGETVTLQRPTIDGEDEYGNDILTYSDVVVGGCAVWPRQTAEINSETGGDRSSVVIGLSLLVPPGVTVTSTDRVTVRGAVYEVDGEPGHWLSFLTGTDAGTQVALRRVEG